MSPKKRDVDVVRVTAYVPIQIWRKMVHYVSYNAVKNDGIPTMSNYGAISNTVSNAINSYCNIVYDYNIHEYKDESCEEGALDKIQEEVKNK